MKTILLAALMAGGCFTVCEAKDWKSLLEQYGDSGQFAQMDSVYALASKEITYENDPVTALDIHTSYGFFLDYQGYYEKAYPIFLEAIEQAQKLNYKDYSPEEVKIIKDADGSARYEKAYILWQLNKLEEAEESITHTIQYFLANKDSTYLTDSYNLSGIIHNKLSRMEESISDFQHALNLAEKNKEYNTARFIIANISGIYNDMEEMDAAIRISRKVFTYPLPDTPTMEDSVKFIKNLWNHAVILCNGHYVQNSFDSTKLALSMLKEHYPPAIKQHVYTQHARNLYLLGKVQKAIHYYQKGFALQKYCVNKREAANNYYTYGYVLAHATDSIGQAIKYLNKALDFYKKESNSFMYTKVLQALAEAEGRRKNYNEAFKLEREAHIANLNSQKVKYKKQLSAFEAKMKTKEKDLQIVSLKAQQAEDKAAFQSKIYLVAGGLILAVLLVILLIIYMRKKKITFEMKQMRLEREIREKETQSKEMAEEMNRKMTEQYLSGLEDSNNRISKELHDGICNELLAIEMSLTQDSKEQATQRISTIREEVRQLSHQLSTPEFEHISLYQMIQVYAERLQTLKEPNIQTYLDKAIQGITIPAESMREVYRIMQEAISNCIKHAQARHLYITVSLCDTEIVLIMEDDGVGFDIQQSHHGLGLRTMQERSLKLKGIYRIESTSGKGTMLSLSFPIV